MEHRIGPNLGQALTPDEIMLAAHAGTEDDLTALLAGTGFPVGARTMPAHMQPLLLNLFGAMGASAAGMDVSSMDPAFILQVVGRRVRELNNGIQAFMDDINSRTDRAAALRESISVMQGAMANHPRRKDNGEVDRDHPGIDLEATVDGTGKTVRQELQEAGFAVPEGRYWNRDQADQSLEQMKTQLEQVNSGNEMQMIHMQNMISQRSQAIQLATNIIQKMNNLSEQLAKAVGGR